MIAVAKRLQNVQEYYFSKKLREVTDLGKNGEPVLNLGIGNPDFGPSKEVIDEMIFSIGKFENHGYQSYKGIPELREAYSNWYQEWFGARLDSEKEVLPLIGSKEGIMHISMTYLEEGDQVLVPNPGYPTYRMAGLLAGAEVIEYELDESNNWCPDFDQLSQLDLSRVKIMWVNYPNMPTGANASITLFQDLLDFGRSNGILICNDNPYSFILNEEPLSIMSLPGAKEVALELNSLSKSHNMAGWRIGVLIGGETHVNNVLKFKSNMDSGMFKPIQQAAIKALNMDRSWYEDLNQIYQKRKTVVHKILDKMDCTYSKDQTGLFVWAKVPNEIESVEVFLDEILYESKVFITPGFVFGSAGERYVRISLCNTEETLKNALGRIKVKPLILEK